MHGGEIDTDTAKAAFGGAGLAGKEAKAPIMVSAGYLMEPADGAREKKKRAGDKK